QDPVGRFSAHDLCRFIGEDGVVSALHAWWLVAGKIEGAAHSGHDAALDSLVAVDKTFGRPHDVGNVCLGCIVEQSPQGVLLWHILADKNAVLRDRIEAGAVSAKAAHHRKSVRYILDVNV